jgi:phosphoribosyl-ATP pyrophosphohydrolase
MSSNTKDPAWPVLVHISGKTGTAALMNRKAYRKSRESGIPWIVHPETGRVLPWAGEPEIVTLEDAPGRFELSLPEGSSAEPYGAAPPPDIDPDDRSDMTDSRGAVSETAVSEISRKNVLDSLAALISQRRQTMPEGSYTTHLFEKGLDKIRKKTGEEAVELLLARDDKDVIYESADLVYHLLVLLEASGLKWSEVTKELARRHAE